MKTVIKAAGHPIISATHKSTLEITKEDFVTPTGDCIVAINSDKSMPELDEVLKNHLRQGNKIRIEVGCNGVIDSLEAQGDSKLTFSDPHVMIIRKSDYVCERTLCIKSDKAAIDLDRKLIEQIKKGKEVTVVITSID